jgi:hypothetical protein
MPAAWDSSPPRHLKRPVTWDKPFGVNISLIPEFDVGERTLRFVDVVCEEGVPVIETAPPRRGKTHRSCHFPRGIYQFPLYRT